MFEDAGSQFSDYSPSQVPRRDMQTSPSAYKFGLNRMRLSFVETIETLGGFCGQSSGIKISKIKAP